MIEAAPSQMLSALPHVPAHLLGTRAALFLLWRTPIPGEVAALRPAPQTPGPDRVRAELQSDVFVFARTA